MNNPLQALKDILNPQHTELIGTIQSANHPNYKVLLTNDSGLVACTSNTNYSIGDRVFIANHEIKRPAPSGQIIEIEV